MAQDDNWASLGGTTAGKREKITGLWVVRVTIQRGEQIGVFVCVSVSNCVCVSVCARPSIEDEW